MYDEIHFTVYTYTYKIIYTLNKIQCFLYIRNNIVGH